MALGVRTPLSAETSPTRRELQGRRGRWGLWLPGDPRVLSGRRRSPGVRRASGDSVRFEAFGKPGAARGGAELSPQPQGVRFRDAKEDQKPVGGVAGEEVVAQGEGSVIVPFERDPKERGLNYIVKMKMPPEGVPRAALCALGSQGLLGRCLRLFGWQGVGGGGRAAMWIGEGGAGTGKGRGSQDSAAWGRLGLSHPRQGALRGPHLNPGEQANDRGAGREGNGVK